MVKQYDIENERAIVASCLVDSSIRKRAAGALRVEDFQGERFRTIFAALVECELKGLIPDNEAIMVHASDEDYGGYEFLDRLRVLEPVANLDFHIDRLRQEAARTKAISYIPELTDLLEDRTVDHLECVRQASELISMLQVGRVKREDAVAEYIEDLDRRCSGQVPFVSTGFETLDSILTEGYGPGLMTVLAGRTGNGKSTFVVDTVRRLLKAPKKPRILVIPFEIGRLRFLDQLASSATLIPFEMLRKTPEELTLAERDEIKRVATKMIASDDRLTVLDNDDFFSNRRDSWSNEEACDQFEAILAEEDYDIAVYDLFQRSLVDLRPSSLEMALVRQQYIGGKYQTHQIIVHQISRKPEERRNKQPELADLKGSGGYEEVPDTVLLAHRPKAYKQFMKKDNIEVKVGKQRYGSRGSTMIAEFLPSVSRLEDDYLAGQRDEEKEEDKSKEETVY